MRKSGILMHLASLPSEYGVGTMGAAARKFADFLSDAGQQYWQLLPICPTSYGDSPYQSFSTFAGNPYFIDLDLLASEGLLDKKEYVSVNWGDDVSRIDYGRLYEQRYPVLKLAAKRFLENEPEDFETFCELQAFWLEDYALFMTLKVFGVIYVLLFVNMVRQVRMSKPVDLLRSENRGEKPPKANWFIALCGVVILA